MFYIDEHITLLKQSAIEGMAATLHHLTATRMMIAINLGNLLRLSAPTQDPTSTSSSSSSTSSLSSSSTHLHDTPDSTQISTNIIDSCDPDYWSRSVALPMSLYHPPSPLPLCTPPLPSSASVSNTQSTSSMFTSPLTIISGSEAFSLLNPTVSTIVSTLLTYVHSYSFSMIGPTLGLIASGSNDSANMMRSDVDSSSSSSSSLPSNPLPNALAPPSDSVSCGVLYTGLSQDLLKAFNQVLEWQPLFFKASNGAALVSSLSIASLYSYSLPLTSDRLTSSSSSYSKANNPINHPTERIFSLSTEECPLFGHNVSLDKQICRPLSFTSSSLMPLTAIVSTETQPQQHKGMASSTVHKYDLPVYRYIQCRDQSDNQQLTNTENTEGVFTENKTPHLTGIPPMIPQWLETSIELSLKDMTKYLSGTSPSSFPSKLKPVFIGGRPNYSQTIEPWKPTRSCLETIQVC